MNDTTFALFSSVALREASAESGGGGPLAGTVEAIYRDCYQDLMRYLLLSGCEAPDAMDFLQEAFLRMVRCLKQGKPIDTPRFWLLRVLRNIRYDERERTSRYVAIDAEHLEAILRRRGGAPPDPEAVALSRDRYERLRVAMGQLTDRQHQCVLLRAHGLKLREIAELLGISAVTVAEACGRAMEKLGRLKYE